MSENRFNDTSTPSFVDEDKIRLGRFPAKWYRIKQNYSSNVAPPRASTPAPYEWVARPLTLRSYTIVPATPSKYGVSNTSTNDVECLLCPKQCTIKDGEVGYCSSRINIEGRLYSRFYARPTSVAIDPIEKKPLFHFLPGSSVFSLGTQGCNLSCKFCQNWKISRPLPANQNLQNLLLPEQVLSLALENNCPSVAFTYNEPTVWSEYVLDVAKLCKEAGIKTVLVSNGMIASCSRKEIYKYIDAANIDLKSITPEFYHKLCGGRLDSVKETLRFIAKETNAWLEITNLIIPTYNDSHEDVLKLCDWIVNELGPNVPLHFSAFFPTYRLVDVAQTPPQLLFDSAALAQRSGIKYVYCGNINAPSKQTTFCPQCGSVLIDRTANRRGKITEQLLVSKERAYCHTCNEEIVGVYR